MFRSSPLSRQNSTQLTQELLSQDAEVPVESLQRVPSLPAVFKPNIGFDREVPGQFQDASASQSLHPSSVRELPSRGQFRAGQGAQNAEGRAAAREEDQRQSESESESQEQAEAEAVVPSL